MRLAKIIIITLSLSVLAITIFLNLTLTEQINGNPNIFLNRATLYQPENGNNGDGSKSNDSRQNSDSETSLSSSGNGESKKNTPGLSSGSQSNNQSSDNSDKERFVGVEGGRVFKKTVDIKVYTKDAENIEFYAKRSDSSPELYLGKGTPQNDNIWQFNWNTASFPNGSYFIIANILTKNEENKRIFVSVTVENEVLTGTENSNDITKNIEQSEDKINNEEKSVDESQKQIEKNVSDKFGDLSSQMADKSGSKDNKPVIEKKLKTLSEKIAEQTRIYGSSAQGKNTKNIKEDAKKEVEDIVDSATNNLGNNSEIGKIEEKIKEAVSGYVDDIDRVLKERKRIETEKNNLLAKDSDNDGLPDIEEIRLKTDPFNADTDQDGFLDGTEVGQGLDPLSSSPTDKIVFQEPKNVKLQQSQSYRVEKIQLIKEPDTGEKVLKLNGQAPPFSFVTIYLYSMPVVIITKADANGNWEYYFDKDLEAGKHTVYATVTDNKGAIEKSSAPFDFVKTENAVMKFIQPKLDTTESPVSYMNKFFVSIILGTILLSILGVTIAIGIYAKQSAKNA